MKVLFVGEGTHDIGPPDMPGTPRMARGVVPSLVRRLLPRIAPDSLALSWTDLSHFVPKDLAVSKRELLGSPLVKRVKTAALVSSRRLHCEGTICVHDRDGKLDRLAELECGRQRAREIVPAGHRIACGVAVESIEAWTLGDPESLAAELVLDISLLGYSVGKVEEYKESSGKVEHRPKAILRHCANLVNREDTVELREAVAARSDPHVLKDRCPVGFGAFVNILQSEFGIQDEVAGASSEE